MPDIFTVIIYFSLTFQIFFDNIFKHSDAGVVQWLEFQPSKLAVWVRFPSPAPNKKKQLRSYLYCFFFIIFSFLLTSVLTVKAAAIFIKSGTINGTTHTLRAPINPTSSDPLP